MVGVNVVSWKGKNQGLGNLVGLRQVVNPPPTITNTTTTKEVKQNQNKIPKPKTRTIRITEDTWLKLKDYSRANHTIPTSYDDLFQELVDFYNEQQEKKYNPYRLV